MKISLVLFAAVLLFVAGADAIKCYECADCDKPKNSVECGIEFEECAVAVENGRKYRDCALLKKCEDLPGILTCNAELQDNCVTCCDTDNCNSAGIANFNVFTIFTVLLLSLFFMKQ